jgi:hypothetical protein
MADSSPLADLLQKRAADPRQFEADGQRIGERSLSELIEADKYLSQKARATGGKTAFRVQKVIPAGLS